MSPALTLGLHTAGGVDTQAKRVHAEEAAAASQDLCRSLREQLAASKLSDEQAQLALASLKASVADVKETQSGMQQASSRELQGLQEALQASVNDCAIRHHFLRPGLRRAEGVWSGPFLRERKGEVPSPLTRTAYGRAPLLHLFPRRLQLGVFL